MTIAASGLIGPTTARAMSHQEDKKDRRPIAGHLPPKGQGQIFGGRGEGNPCDLCGLPIQSSQIEYEVEWQDAGGMRRAHLHLACYEQLRSEQRE
jgi:hypothetical protein